jgi:hypothetical protein
LVVYSSPWLGTDTPGPIFNLTVHQLKLKRRAGLTPFAVRPVAQMEPMLTSNRLVTGGYFHRWPGDLEWGNGTEWLAWYGLVVDTGRAMEPVDR